MFEKAIRDHFFIHLKIIYHTYMICIYTERLKEVMPFEYTMLPLIIIKLTKNHSMRCEELPFEFLVIWVQETIKTIYAPAIADGCLPKVEDRFLLVKASCMLDTGLRIWAGSDLKASTLRMSFHRIWSREVTNSPTQLWHLGSTIVWDIPYNSMRYPQGYNSGTHIWR